MKRKVMLFLIVLGVLALVVPAQAVDPNDPNAPVWDLTYEGDVYPDQADPDWQNTNVGVQSLGSDPNAPGGPVDWLHLDTFNNPGSSYFQRAGVITDIANTGVVVDIRMRVFDNTLQCGGMTFGDANAKGAYWRFYCKENTNDNMSIGRSVGGLTYPAIPAPDPTEWHVYHTVAKGDLWWLWIDGQLIWTDNTYTMSDRILIGDATGAGNDALIDIDYIRVLNGVDPNMPVAWYDFEVGTFDPNVPVKNGGLAGSAADGVLNGGVSIVDDPFTITSDAGTHEFGQVMDFQGNIGDYMDCGGGGGWAQMTDTTVMFWVRGDFEQAVWVPAAKAAASPNASWMFAGDQGDGSLYFKGYQEPPNGSGATPIGSLPIDGQWHHVCGVYDTSAIGANGTGQTHIYIDGTLAQTIDNFAAGPSYGTSDVWFGGTERYISNPFYYNGLMDDIRIYDRVMTVEELNTIPGVGGDMDIVCLEALAGDVDGDCDVDLNDLALLAADWAQCNLNPPDACWQ